MRLASIVVLSTAGLATAALAVPQYTAWSTPVNAERVPGAGATLNTPAVDGCVSLSRDGLQLYFNSNRAGSQDIYVATRPDRESGFANPQPLPASINTPASEFCPTIAQGNRLYFSRSQGSDPGVLMVSRDRPDGWSDPVALGGGVNTTLMEESVEIFEDESGVEVMVFSRRPASGPGGQIFQRVGDGPVEPVPGGPNAAGANNRPSVSRDGLEMYFDSTRQGGLGGPDLWMASRASTDQLFGAAEHLGALNAPGFDARPSLSWDEASSTSRPTARAANRRRPISGAPAARGRAGRAPYRSRRTGILKRRGWDSRAHPCPAALPRRFATAARRARRRASFR